MMRRNVWIAVINILVVVTLAGAFPRVGCTAYEDVKAVAQRGLHAWLSAIPEGERQSYGFKSAAELTQARVGEPYAIAIIDATTLDSYTGADISSIAREVSTRVYVPIEVGGQIRALLEVSRKNGTWEIVAIGREPVARQMEQARRLTTSGTTGHPRVIRVFLKNNSYQDLLAVVKGGRTLVLPLVSSSPALRWALPSTATLIEPKPVLLNLRDIQLRSIQPSK